MSNKIKQEFMSRKDPVRLNKYLSEAGVCSRREADRLIESGRVKVDGKTAGMGMKVLPGQEVRVGRKVVSRSGEMVVLAVNKPVGIVCTEAHRERNSIVRFLNYPVRVTYVGRLDKDSRGLEKMSAGVPILDTVTRPCRVQKIGKYTFTIILTQGLNRQIRRMCEALGYEVKDLVRTRIMNIELGKLREGEYRKLTDRELDCLYEQIRDSSNETVIS